MERIEGRQAWAGISDGDREAIGAAAIELVATWQGLERSATARGARPFETADPLLSALLEHLIGAAEPALAIGSGSPPPVPSMIGPVCRSCGCSQFDACFPGCGWAEPDLCTACAPAEREPAAAAEVIRSAFS